MSITGFYFCSMLRFFLHQLTGSLFSLNVSGLYTFRMIQDFSYNIITPPKLFGKMNGFTCSFWKYMTFSFLHLLFHKNHLLLSFQNQARRPSTRVFCVKTNAPRHVVVSCLRCGLQPCWTDHWHRLEGCANAKV